MTNSVLSTHNSGLRVFSAAILSALLIVMPFVQLAAAEGQRSQSRVQRPENGREPTDSKSQNETANISAAPENLFLNAPIPKPAPEPFAVTAAQLKVTLDDGLSVGQSKRPGETITYTATIQNTNPTDDATNVIFSNDLTANPNLTFVAGSVQSQPIAKNDTYPVLGNVRIDVPQASGLLANDFDPDTSGNSGLTVTTAPTTSVRGGDVSINTATGAFTYNPPAGYDGTDSFSYTVTDATGKTDTATVNITITGMIWFINNAAAVCTSRAAGCGRLSNPFSDLQSFAAAQGGAGTNNGDTVDPEAGDNIFLYTGNSPGSPYTAPLTLLNTQKLIGQGATDTLVTISGVTVPSHSDPLPATNEPTGTNPTPPTITSAAGGILLANGNTLRGFNVGAVGNAQSKIQGTNFGTLAVGKTSEPDVSFSGAGRIFNLTTGTFAAGSGINTAASTSSSGGAAIFLSGITGVGALTIVTTSVAGGSGNGIDVNGSTADISFGSTTITGGTNGVALYNNSAGTRSFVSLSISSGSGTGFQHSDPDGAVVTQTGGGAVSVTGATTITNPGGAGIDVQNSNADLSFAGTTVNKNATSSVGVNLVNNATRTITFSTLAVTTTNAFALLTNTSGTVIVTNAVGSSLTQSGAGGGAASLTNTALNLNFTTVSSTSGGNGLIFSTGTGTFSAGTTNLQSNAGVGILMSSSAVASNFGNTTVNASAGDAVDISGQTGNVTFAALNLSPNATLRGLDVSNTSGTITSTSGNIATTGAPAIVIAGPAGRTPLAMVLTNIDSTNSTTTGIDLDLVSGSLTVNDAGTATNIQNSTGTGIEVTNTGVGTMNFGNTTVNASGNANGDDTGTGVLLANNAGAVTFGTLAVTPDSGERGLYATDNDGTAAGAITTGSGTITTTNDTAVEITGQAIGNRTPLNIQLTTVNTTGGALAANGIRLVNTSATGSPGGFRVLGNAGSCSNATPSCTGGRITNTTGADGLTGGNGIQLENVDNARFTRMRLDTNPNNGIRGLNVNTFVLDASYVHGNGNNVSGTLHESGVQFDGAGANGLVGSASITNSDIRNNHDFNTYFDNNSGTLHLTMSGNTIRETNSAVLSNDNVLIDLDGTATVFVSVTGSTFANAGGSHFQVSLGGNSVAHVTFTGNTMTGTEDDTPNYLGMNVSILSGSWNGTCRYNISNNTITGTNSGHAIHTNKGSGTGAMQGTISNNTIGNAADAESGASDSSGITVASRGVSGSHTALVSGNVINQTNEFGINLEVGEDGNASLTSTAASLDVTVTGNTIGLQGVNGLHGIHMNNGIIPGDNPLSCSDIGGAGALANNVALAGGDGAGGAPANGGSDIRPRERFGAQIRLPGYGGGQFDLAAVNAYMTGRNVLTTVSAGSDGDAAGVNDGYVGGATCAQPSAPTLPTPVAFFEAPNSNQREYFASIISSETHATVIAAANTREVGPAVSPASLLTPIASALTSSASESGARIAPTHKAEVSDQRSEVRTAEIGTRESEVSAHHTLNSKLETRNARSEEKAEVRSHQSTVANLATANANVVAAAPVAGSFNVSIGTLPANDSVTITFQVQIADTLTPASANTVSNQATVTADGPINKVSDDPQTTPPAAGDGNDATVTPIDKFEPVIDIQSSDTTSDETDPVTFTATLTHGTALVDPLPTGTVSFVDTQGDALPGNDEILCSNVALTVNALNSTAQCITTAVDAGTRTIAAIYSGDGRYDSATDTVTQTVTACTQNPVVINTNDSGAGSLRDAIANVCSAPNNNITFNIPEADPGFVGGVYTITVLTELAVAKNANITGPNSVTNTNPIVVSGNNATRVFNINAGMTAGISALTISGGNHVGSGGGILNDHGTLTLTNVTVSGNTSGAGGGIYVDGSTSGTASLTVISSTISGNTGTISGGGIYVTGLGGGAATLVMTNSTVSGNNADVHGGGVAATVSTTSTLTNVTVTNNRADNDNNATGGGGGIASFGTMTLSNTILAGNFNENGVTDASDDAAGSTFEAASAYNLIGNGDGTTGITHAVNNNKVGTGASPIDAVIGPLANNGGPTFTHRILGNGSPAMDAGNTALTTDQRGQPRPKDNLHIANAAGGDGDDIGAYEAPLPPSVPNLDAASDTGASSTDDYTADNTPTFTIQGVETGAFVELLTGATVVASGTVASMCSGFPCIQLTVTPALADGLYSFTARQTVAGGMSPTSTGLNVTIDTGAPGAPTIDLQAGSDSGSSNSDDITNATTRTFDIGNTETGATVELLRDGNPITSTTGNGGTVTLSDSTAAVSGTTYAYTARQTDQGGNPTSSAPLNVLFDSTAPSVSSIVRANPNPTNAANVDFTVTFSEAVTGVDTADFVLTNTGGISGASVTTVTPITALQYTVTVNTGTGEGTIRLDLSDNDSIADVAGNLLGGAGAQNFTTGEVYTVDRTQPTADITDVTPDPRNTAVSSITIVFNEAVTGFDLADLTLTLNGGGNLLTGAQTLNTADNITWTLGNLSGLTAADGTYLLTLTASGSGITDSATNALAGNATDSWVKDTAAPTVTINQASTQVDPTSASPINFTVVFSEAVTGFDNTDVTFSGAGATTATVTEVAPNDGTTYNVAISGMNADGTVQATVNANAAQDGVGNNSAASTSTDNQVTFVNVVTINVQDAKVPEPASPNTIDMTFTVSLSAPAPAGGVNVDFTTNNVSATSGTCGTPGADYVLTSGQVNFTAGQQVKTINVPICSDSVSDDGETFTVTLSNPTSPGVIGDGTATGTITGNTPGTLVISELRTSGPAGASDDFVEIYNNSNAPVTVAASDISAGYGLYKMGADCNATPVLIGVIPNGTVIPARGHYLFTGSAYSLGNYGGSGAAAGNLTFSSDLDNDANVGLFSTSDVLNISSVNRLDAVGFGLNIGGTCNLLREADTLPAMAGSTLQYSYFRKMCEWIAGSGCTVPGIPKDTNNNAADFWLADTTASATTGRLGSPGPENLASPIRRDNANNPGSGGFDVFLLDGTVGTAAHPNRTRQGGDPVGTFGSMTLRYRVVNNTGVNVTRLRYRVVDISTAIQPAGPTADLRALSVLTQTVSPVGDQVTCTSAGAGAAPCTVSVSGTTLETPPNQAIGGGYNSTLSSGTVTTGTPLAPGASILINFKLGVEKTGTFRFYIIVEALP